MSHSRVLAKICGLTCVEDARACAELGVDWIGLNFHRPSPRYIAPEIAAEVLAALPDGVTTVGVFVDRRPAEVAELAWRLGLDAVQLHGREPVEDLAALRGLRVIRAFRLRSSADWAIVSEFLARSEDLGCPPVGVLVDAFVAGHPGGTGTAIERSVLAARPALPNLILAGGLTPENVAEKVVSVRPWMVHVASGVESTPGRKDPAAISAFLRAVRQGEGDPTTPADRLRPPRRNEPFHGPGTVEATIDSETVDKLSDEL